MASCITPRARGTWCPNGPPGAPIRPQQVPMAFFGWSAKHSGPKGSCWGPNSVAPHMAPLCAHFCILIWSPSWLIRLVHIMESADLSYRPRVHHSSNSWLIPIRDEGWSLLGWELGSSANNAGWHSEDEVLPHFRPLSLEGNFMQAAADHLLVP